MRRFGRCNFALEHLFIMDLTQLTIREAHEGLKKKDFSARELCEAYLAQIENKNREIFAYLTVTKEKALEQAGAIDEKIAAGKNISLLAGIPLAIKDNILIEDVKCTAGSKFLENYIAPYDATVIKKLRAEGAVFLGKTNLDEFAMGSSCEYSAFGPTRNPHNLNKVAGGSSGGSAAAVAGKMALAALGSDTGGSIRLPASFCGVVGLSPTYGRVSRYGLIAMASSLDQIGPITKTVSDAKIVFEAIAGRDEKDSTSLPLKPKIKNKKLKIEKEEIENLRIGIPKEYFIKGIDKEAEQLVKRAIKKFEEAGAKIEEISLPHTEYALPAYYLIVPSEVSANLARYDGIKYGRRAANQKQKSSNLLDIYLWSRKQGFGNEVKRRIMLGTFALSHGYYEAYYLRAQKVRTKIKEDFERAFQKVDVILAPASSGPAFDIGAKSKDPLQMYLEDIFLVPSKLAGLPSLSLPCGKVDKLPFGFQLIGNIFEEEKLLQIGEFFEENYYECS